METPAIKSATDHVAHTTAGGDEASGSRKRRLSIIAKPTVSRPYGGPLANLRDVQRRPQVSGDVDVSSFDHHRPVSSSGPEHAAYRTGSTQQAPIDWSRFEQGMLPLIQMGDNIVRTREKMVNDAVELSNILAKQIVDTAR